MFVDVSRALSVALLLLVPPVVVLLQLNVTEAIRKWRRGRLTAVGGELGTRRRRRGPAIVGAWGLGVTPITFAPTRRRRRGQGRDGKPQGAVALDDSSVELNFDENIDMIVPSWE